VNKMKLEVGMYVRTNLGIAKIISSEKNHLGNEFLLDKEIIDTHEDYYTNYMYDYKFYLEQIIKTSHNIMELIEVGDYVNGEKVLLANEGHIKVGTGRDYIVFNNEKFIKSIVTKETFESMSYKAGE